MKSDSAPGWDNIPTSLLKSGEKIIVPVISHLANLCFEQGVFPSAFKLALITPVHKGGDKTDPSNYRPISVLLSISKILEKLINRRLVNYLTKLNILSTSQFGFRQGLSTEDAVMALTSVVIDKVDNRNKCLAVFLDLKKAFDTVSIPILLSRFENIGISGSALQLLTQYANERKQRVKIGEYTSQEETISFGVPQGSVLGPTMFLLYINSLCNMKLDKGHIFSYANDTAIVFEGKTWDDVRKSTENGLMSVKNWLDSNLLTLSLVKTN